MIFFYFVSLLEMCELNFQVSNFHTNINSLEFSLLLSKIDLSETILRVKWWIKEERNKKTKKKTKIQTHNKVYSKPVSLMKCHQVRSLIHFQVSIIVICPKAIQLDCFYFILFSYLDQNLFYTYIFNHWMASNCLHRVDLFLSPLFSVTSLKSQLIVQFLVLLLWSAL